MLLGLLHLVVMLMMRMIRMQRRRRRLHERLAMEAERAERLARQIHGRRVLVVLGSGCCGRGVMQADLRLRQVSGQVMMRVVRMMRVVSGRPDAHQARRSGSRARRAVVVAATDRRRRRLSAERCAARIFIAASRRSDGTAVVRAGHQARVVVRFAVFVHEHWHRDAFRRILKYS